MKVRLGRRGDYAIRAVLAVARAPDGERRKARQITREMDIPENFATQILAALARGGVLDAVAGPGGGYSLARPAEEISILEVVEIAEGPIALDECMLRGGPCDWDQGCPMHGVWSEAQAALAEHLAGASIAAIADLDARIEAGEHSWPGERPHATMVPRRGQRNPLRP